MFVELIVFRLFWLGVIEATYPALCPSFFEVDLAPAILRFLFRDGPLPSDPEALGSLRLDDNPPLAPLNVNHGVSGHDDTPSTRSSRAYTSVLYIARVNNA